VVDLGDVELQPPQTPPGAIGIYPAALDNEIVIDHVIEGSPAESAGLLQGDVITRVDDVKVRTPDELRQQVIGTPGTPVRLSVRRAGVTSFVTVVRAPKTVQ
jgi:C-terminal processing protease CtpA/Prc